jgi:hypothetical protein
MGGLLSPVEKWPDFENKWNAVLKEFRLPYFHMREFEARHPVSGERMYGFKGWDNYKRKRLYGKLMRIIQNTHAMPIGAIVPMEAYREVCGAWESFLQDPYLFAYQNVLAHTTSFMEVVRAPSNVKAAFVFSNQVEFRHRALELFEQIHKRGLFTKRIAYEPDFRDMREIVPLQAADVVAYEMYKEYDRRIYRPNDKPRWAFPEIETMAHRHGFALTCRFYTREELIEQAEEAKRLVRKNAYWANRNKSEKD